MQQRFVKAAYNSALDVCITSVGIQDFVLMVACACRLCVPVRAWMYCLQGLSAQHYNNELAAADQLLSVSPLAGNDDAWAVAQASNWA